MTKMPLLPGLRKGFILFRRTGSLYLQSTIFLRKEKSWKRGTHFYRCTKQKKLEKMESTESNNKELQYEISLKLFCDEEVDDNFSSLLF